jgi:hypothetical protein
MWRIITISNNIIFIISGEMLAALAKRMNKLGRMGSWQNCFSSIFKDQYFLGFDR